MKNEFDIILYHKIIIISSILTCKGILKCKYLMHVNIALSYIHIHSK
jgi:hypothetical protein